LNNLSTTLFKIKNSNIGILSTDITAIMTNPVLFFTLGYNEEIHLASDSKYAFCICNYLVTYYSAICHPNFLLAKFLPVLVLMVVAPKAEDTHTSLDKELLLAFAIPLLGTYARVCKSIYERS
jgi:hypothetical protein